MAAPALAVPHLESSLLGSTLLLLSTITSFALAAIGVLAFRRRGSLSYFLVAAALVVFALKALVGGLTVVGIVEIQLHDVIEHGLDLLMGLLLLGAIYVARGDHDCRLLDRSAGEM